MFKKNLPLYLLIFFSTVLSIYFRLFDKLGTDFYLFWDSMVLYCGPYYFSLDKNPYGLINECSDRVSNFKYVYLPIYLEWKPKLVLKNMDSINYSIIAANDFIS